MVTNPKLEISVLFCCKNLKKARKNPFKCLRDKRRIMSNVVGTNTSAAASVETEEKELEERLKEEFKKYKKYKLICDCLEECASEDGQISEHLKKKITSIMLDVSSSQVLALDEYSNLLGLPTPKTELTYSESKEMHHFLKIKLHENCKTVSEILESNEEDFDESVLIEYKTKLTIEQELYVENLLKLQELLEEMTNMRLKKVPVIVEQKIKETSLQSRLNYIKSQIAKEKVRVDIFTETSGSLKAYKEVLKDIREQQAVYKKEIEELTDLKEKYKQVSCKQYDDILKSYLQYKASIEKKKLISRTLRN